MSNRDPMADVIQANRDAILQIHGEGISRIAKAAQTGKIDLVLEIVRAVWAFHPMHSETWCGWPEGS